MSKNNTSLINNKKWVNALLSYESSNDKEISNETLIEIKNELKEIKNLLTTKTSIILTGPIIMKELDRIRGGK